MLYFNTNKPHFFPRRIPVVLENRRSSRGGGGVHPLHPPPRSAPAVTIVIQLYKKGDKVENYRPVCRTSIASKICEKIVRKSIVNFWTDHQFFKREQFFFMTKRSCLSQLFDTFHSWTKERNDSHKVDVILLDFTKACDSVPHQRLLAKLKGYGIGGYLLNWLTHFIVGRKQRASFRGHLDDGHLWCSMPILSILQLA